MKNVMDKISIQRADIGHWLAVEIDEGALVPVAPLNALQLFFNAGGCWGN